MNVSGLSWEGDWVELICALSNLTHLAIHNYHDMDGIFLKKLDDAYKNMDVQYLRFQDDILVLCQTQQQLNRCKKRMMKVLRERGLSLSRKKS